MSYSCAHMGRGVFFPSLIGTFLFLSPALNAQSNAFELLLRTPHDVSCIGAGNQAYPDGSPTSALQFNPASAAFGGGARLSLFGRPVYSYCCTPIAVRAVAASLRPPDLPGGLALEYAFQKTPAFRYYMAGPNIAPGGLVEPFESSIAAACGVSLGKNWYAGVSGRYARWCDRASERRRIEMWTYGAGAIWRSRLVNRTLAAAVSFMGFGAPFTDPLSGQTINPPAEFLLAMVTSAVENGGLSIPLMFSVSKPVSETEEAGSPRSSIASFFPSWKRFPRDATLHTGAGLQWSGLWGDGTAGMHTRVIFGNATSGPWAGLKNIFTLGLEAGFEWNGVDAVVGFASEWHTMPHDPYSLATPLPREMFSCSVRIPWFPVAESAGRRGVADRVRRGMIAAGASWTTFLGRYRADANTRYADASALAIEAAFAINPRLAVVVETSYEKTTVIAGCDCFPTGPVGVPFEGWHSVFGYSVALRCFPIRALNGFYVQGGAGAVRTRTDWGKALSSIAYAPLFAVGTGVIIHVYAPLHLIPCMEFAVYPGRIQASDILHLGGYSLMKGGVNIGWVFGDSSNP